MHNQKELISTQLRSGPAVRFSLARPRGPPLSVQPVLCCRVTDYTHFGLGMPCLGSCVRVVVCWFRVCVCVCVFDFLLHTFGL